MATRRSPLALAGLVLVAALMSLLFNGFCPDVCRAQPESATVYKGKLSDGKSDYNILVPPNWNGTLFVSLDTLAASGRRDSEKVVRDWLLDHEYALAGTTREYTGWDITKSASLLVEAVDTFTKLVAKPDRTIAWGKSLGGGTTRAAIQLFPDRFDGAVPMCGGGGGTIAMFNHQLDTAFALDVLLGSDYGIGIKIHNVQDYREEQRRVQEIVHRAQQTPEGRARLVLAGAFSQIPLWNSTDQTEPASDDWAAQQANVADALPFAVGSYYFNFVENLAGGPFTWNHGIDYRRQLDRSGYRKLVEVLYGRAKLDLDADLERLEKAPRLSANPDAVGFVEKNNITYTGNLRQPVLALTTTGDGAGPISDQNSYADIVRYAGTSDLLRQAFAHRPGHCNFTAGEQVAVFETLIKRLDTGNWEENATADRLTELVTALQAETSLDLGGSNFVPIDPPEALRTWDARNWGSYKPAESK